MKYILILMNMVTIDCVCQCCFEKHLISYISYIKKSIDRSKKTTDLFLFLGPINIKNEILIPTRILLVCIICLL